MCWEAIRVYSLGVTHTGSAAPFPTHAFFIPDEGFPMSHQLNHGIPWTLMTEEGKCQKKVILGKLAFSGMQEARSQVVKGTRVTFFWLLKCFKVQMCLFCLQKLFFLFFFIFSSILEKLHLLKHTASCHCHNVSVEISSFWICSTKKNIRYHSHLIPMLF